MRVWRPERRLILYAHGPLGPVYLDWAPEPTGAGYNKDLNDAIDVATAEYARRRATPAKGRPGKEGA